MKLRKPKRYRKALRKVSSCPRKKGGNGKRAVVHRPVRAVEHVRGRSPAFPLSTDQIERLRRYVRSLHIVKGQLYELAHVEVERTASMMTIEKW